MNNAVSTATDMSPETMMFGYPLPLRATSLIQLDCPSQQEIEGGTYRLPLRVRAHQIKDKATKHQSLLDKQNDKLRTNEYQVGDLVLKQVMQHSTVGTRHALECKYTGPYENNISGKLVSDPRQPVSEIRDSSEVPYRSIETFRATGLTVHKPNMGPGSAASDQYSQLSRFIQNKKKTFLSRN